MVWFLRSIELHDGQWACRRGRYQYDVHTSLADSLAHLREITREIGHAQLFAHLLTGEVLRIEP